MVVLGAFARRTATVLLLFHFLACQLPPILGVAVYTFATWAVYGDAKRWETLADAGLDQASALILSSDMPEPGEVVRLARARRPSLRVMVRCGHLREVESLRALGAEVVVSGEGEIAIALTEAVLDAQGADPETVAGTRAAIRTTLIAAAKL